MGKFVFYLLIGIIANIILFVLCAIPWYIVITISTWYIPLAFATTILGAIIIAWFAFDVWDII